MANLACSTRKRKSNCPDLLKPKISNFCLQLFPNGHAVYKAQDVVLLDGTPKELSADLDILWNKIISDTMTSVLRGPLKRLTNYFGLNWTKAYDAFEKAAHGTVLYAPCLCGGKSTSMTFASSRNRREGKGNKTTATKCEFEGKCALHLASKKKGKALVPWSRRPVPICPWCDDEESVSSSDWTRVQIYQMVWDRLHCIVWVVRGPYAKCASGVPN